MPFYVEVRRPSNGLMLAMFHCWGNYYYRLANGAEFPLDVVYGWCHRCEEFVEAERLYTLEELQEQVDVFAARRSEWPQIDAESASWSKKTTGRTFPAHLKQEALYNMWVAALAWRQSRESPPRCLGCGSMFAIKILPCNEEVPHPDGVGTIEVVDAAGHAVCYDFPDAVYFSGEGTRIPE